MTDSVGSHDGNATNGAASPPVECSHMLEWQKAGKNQARHSTIMAPSRDRGPREDPTPKEMVLGTDGNPVRST